MFYKKKKKEDIDIQYTSVFAAEYLDTRYKELTQEELKTTQNIQNITKTVQSVMDELSTLTDEMDAFRSIFSNIQMTVNELIIVKQGITCSVDEAEEQVKVLEDSSDNVERKFQNMGDTFLGLQSAVQEIQKSAFGIVNIANQTSLLSMNASIEAAHAGEFGKGFAVVAKDVKMLSEKIKELVEDVDHGIQKVLLGMESLNESIVDSQSALKKSIEQMEKTHGIFDKIKLEAGKTEVTQENITQAVETSAKSVKQLGNYVTISKKNYEQVVEAIHYINDHETNKGFIFEDIDNILQQILILMKERKEKES